MGSGHLGLVSGERFKNISSLAFGGLDLKTAYLGYLLGDQIATFWSHIVEHLARHWNVTF
jgi:hypothetical protein